MWWQLKCVAVPLVCVIVFGFLLTVFRIFFILLFFLYNHMWHSHLLIYALSFLIIFDVLVFSVQYTWKEYLLFSDDGCVLNYLYVLSIFKNLPGLSNLLNFEKVLHSMALADSLQIRLLFCFPDWSLTQIDLPACLCLANARIKYLLNHTQ